MNTDDESDERTETIDFEETAPLTERLMNLGREAEEAGMSGGNLVGAFMTAAVLVGKMAGVSSEEMTRIFAMFQSRADLMPDDDEPQAQGEC